MTLQSTSGTGPNMLQKVEFEDEVQELDRSYMLRPSYYWELVQRRWLYFLLPFLIIAAGGLAVARLLPAVFLSEGKILVESQQIPTELVRPTVTSAAQERIQIIEQRTMTRDNLVAIADKFNLFPDKRQFMSVTDVVELMRKSIRIAPVDTGLDFKQNLRNPAIVFSVGFESADPRAAAQVANELMTRILNEDLRDRTNRASDTTKFLAREVQKLQAERDALDVKMAQLKLAQAQAARERIAAKPDEPTTLLGQLKSELAQKSATYTEKHPVLQALRRQISAMEKEIASTAKGTPPIASDDATLAVSLEALKAQQDTVEKNLDAAQTKLATARVGESLERNQQSEKLETIEQPSEPQKPVKPNRPKVAGLAVLLAAAIGAGLAFVAEIADKAIRRTSDIYGVVDSRLVVTIPYITTSRELISRKRRLRLILFGLAGILVVAIIAAVLVLPLDLMISKAMVGLIK